MQTGELVTRGCWLWKIKTRTEIRLNVKPVAAFKSALSKWVRLGACGSRKVRQAVQTDRSG